jgi:hypothetical protein
MSRVVDNETTCLGLPERGPREGESFKHDVVRAPQPARPSAEGLEMSIDNFGGRGGFFGAFERGRA